MQSRAIMHKHTLSTFVNSISQKATYLDIGSGQPLLMLHGFLGEKTCWLPLSSTCGNSRRQFLRSIRCFAATAVENADR